MSAHTPGPLTFEPLRSDDGLGYIVDANGREVSHHGVTERSRDENIANGNLFAAAPEMLEALRLIDEFAWTALEANCEEARDELNRRVNVARAAIARAEGRS